MIDKLFYLKAVLRALEKQIKIGKNRLAQIDRLETINYFASNPVLSELYIKRKSIETLLNSDIKEHDEIKIEIEELSNLGENKI